MGFSKSTCPNTCPICAKQSRLHKRNKHLLLQTGNPGKAQPNHGADLIAIVSGLQNRSLRVDQMIYVLQ